MCEMLVLTSLLIQAAGAPPTAAQPRPAPYEGEWLVEVIDNIKVMPESQVTMSIDGTHISGLASCNVYRGGFTVHGTRVEVGELLRTMKACDPARMGEERDFLALLRDVVRYQFGSEKSLELTTSDGKIITARRP